MVQVKPPEDWDAGSDPEPPPVEKKPFVKPVPDPRLPETVSSVSGSVAEGLENKKAGAIRDAEKRWQGQDDEDAASAEPSGNNRNQAKQPDLPGDQWDSSRAKQRKKLLFVFAMSSAILVLGVAAIIFAVMQFTGDSNSSEKEKSQLAKNEKSKDSESNKKSAAEKEKTGDQASKSNDPENGKNKSNDSDRKNENTKESNSPKKNVDDSSSNKSPVKQKTPAKSEPEKSKTDKNNTNEPKKKSDDAPPDFAGKSDEIDEGALPEFFRELDTISGIFEQDEPLLKLREAFEEKDLPGNYGLSRYFVSKSLKRTPDRDLALAVPIASVNFKQTPLLQILHFHYQLTGVPVAIDITPVLLAGVRLDEKLDFSANNVTTHEMLKQLASQLGLELVEGKNSFVLTIKDRDNLIEREYPVEDLARNSDESSKLVGMIETYINRTTWSKVGGVGIVSSNNEKQTIVVKHYGWAQVRVEELLRNLRKRRDLPPKSPNPNFPDSQHRLALGKTTAEKQLTLLYADPISLSELLASMASDFDLHVFVNWEATGDQLLPSGNLPLAVENETFGQFIEEFADGVKLQLVWHAPNVVELTTQIGAASNLTFESYSIDKAISPSFDAEKLITALRNFLTSNGLAEFDRAELGFDPIDQKAIYAVLPQSAHLNVRKILLSAEKASKIE